MAKSKYEFISQSEFARRKGVNKNAVTDAIKIGRIEFSSQKDERGNRLICWETEKDKWEQNKTRDLVTKISSKQKGSKALIENEVKDEISDISDIKDDVPYMTAKEPTRFSTEEGIEGVPGTYQYEATRKVRYDANRNKLKYLEEIGKVLPFDAALNMFYKLLNGLRDSVMSYPARCSGIICQLVESTLSQSDIKITPEMKNDMKAKIRDVIDSECRNTLDQIQLDVDKDYKKDFLDDQKKHKRGRPS